MESRALLDLYSNNVEIRFVCHMFSQRLVLFLNSLPMEQANKQQQPRTECCCAGAQKFEQELRTSIEIIVENDKFERIVLYNKQTSRCGAATPRPNRPKLIVIAGQEQRQDVQRYQYSKYNTTKLKARRGPFSLGADLAACISSPLPQNRTTTVGHCTSNLYLTYLIYQF